APTTAKGTVRAEKRAAFRARRQNMTASFLVGVLVDRCGLYDHIWDLKLDGSTGPSIFFTIHCDAGCVAGCDRRMINRYGTGLATFFCDFRMVSFSAVRSDLMSSKLSQFLRYSFAPNKSVVVASRASVSRLSKWACASQGPPGTQPLDV